jgi:hypothetical protein
MAFNVSAVFTLLTLAVGVLAASRTGPPSGAKVVRAGTSSYDEYSTVQAAVNALPNDGTTQSIFIYPGTYCEQVYIARSGHTTVRFACLPSLGMVALTCRCRVRSTGIRTTRRHTPGTKSRSLRLSLPIRPAPTMRLGRCAFMGMIRRCIILMLRIRMGRVRRRSRIVTTGAVPVRMVVGSMDTRFVVRLDSFRRVC